MVLGVLGISRWVLGGQGAARGRLRRLLGGLWALFGAVLAPKMAPRLRQVGAKFVLKNHG